jgi:hypothetical protein
VKRPTLSETEAADAYGLPLLAHPADSWRPTDTMTSTAPDLL